MLWADKYRPRLLDRVTLHKDVAVRLKQLVEAGDCPHLLFYGPPGAGKKTLIMALLRELFGASAERVKVETKPWKIEAGTRNIELELTTISSNHHVEMSPSDAGFQDRYVVQEIIKEMARSKPLESAVTFGRSSASAGTSSGGGGANQKGGFKVVVLNEVDRLSREAQHSLRRTMEKYSATCRIVMCCSSSSQVSEAIRSRCLNLRIPGPTHEQIVEALSDVADQERLTLPPTFAARVALHSQRNLRKALLTLEASKATQYPFLPDQEPQHNDWELYIADIAKDIITEQTPRRLFQVRGKLYELLVNCIPPSVIIKRLTIELMRKMDAELKHELAHWASFYEHRLHLGQKAIFHLEAFVAKIMSVYKGFIVATFG